MTCFNHYLKDRVTNEANYNLILAHNNKVGALSVTVHEVVHVACQTLTIVIHLSFMLLYDIFESWLCDLFKLICSDIITGKS